MTGFLIEQRRQRLLLQGFVLSRSLSESQSLMVPRVNDGPALGED